MKPEDVKIKSEIARLVHELVSKQEVDGAWRFVFETGPMTDASMLMLLSILGARNAAQLETQDFYKESSKWMTLLAQRLIRTQSENGAWKQAEDDEGHLSSTVEAYTALLMTGILSREDTRMIKAEMFILQNGGVEKAHPSTKFMLALHGLYPWPKMNPLPLFLLHLPKWAPLSFHKWTSYVRAHFAPLLILSHFKYRVLQPSNRNIHHLYATHKYEMLADQTSFTPKYVHFRMTETALQKAEQFILQQIEKDGTLYSYASSTFFMIYALLALGYQKDSPVITQAVQGLLSFGVISSTNSEAHIQNSPSTLWDTALVSYALQQAGIPEEASVIRKSVRYLLRFQQREKRKVHGGNNTHYTGGWGFSESNASNPDVDDTQAAMRAISGMIGRNTEVQEAWRRGLSYLFTMQNKDGGWAAFEKNSAVVSSRWLSIRNFSDTASDPSAADVTGRTLEMLGTYGRLTSAHPRIEKGTDWLIQHQEQDGSWYGRWGVTYIYGTWAAVTGLCAVGVPKDHPVIRKAACWLQRIKLQDGGWGESCRSDVLRHYVPAPYSTIVHTAWALDTLIAIYDEPTEAMKSAMEKLIEWNQDLVSKRREYPTGAGLPGHFYIYYHSYPYIWPLLTLSHYEQKYG
ncbi:prenyltransferase/squalene oxidase repeat-containing protein [Paenibacillus sp. Marseille-Q4541]|uniref:terpene cyclase/mutase family protein n=1 Tax=Paenibacillus sp. Marseille-Q4541 TaxID=2831522 RepID=UPI002018DE29|nr:prenyltransferase/squalene oxidase repeat-containing protein [Paenibacillus sp. Marseille-Q4541]